MLRILATIASVICIAAVVMLLGGAAYVWSQGRLTTENVNSIAEILGGSDQAPPAEPEIPEELAQVAKDEVIEARAMKILALEARKREIDLLKGMIETKAAQIVKDKQALDRAQNAFKKQLEEVEEELLSDAAEQARGILLALPAEEAVAKLMTLEPNEAVMLMKGITDKQHAKILQEFRSQEETLRGNEIFQAIVRGRPKREVIDDAIRTAAGN